MNENENMTIDERFKHSAGGIPRQRCQCHLQQNASAYVPRRDMLREVAADSRTVFNAPDRATAEAYLVYIIAEYEKTASRLADWIEKNLPDGLTVFDFPDAHRRKNRTVDGLEQVSQEVKRRIRVVGILPHKAACLRLVRAILMEIDEK